MASGGDRERRMVFDIRGRRRYAVKVVYGILAVLMGLSLFLVVGPLNIGEIFSENGSGGNPAQPFLEQEARLERKLKKEPENADLLASLTRARVTAGNTLVEVSPTGQRLMTREAVDELQKASQSWDEYLKAAKQPSVGLAQVVAPAFFVLAETSGGSQIMPNLKAAVGAQEVVARQRPTLNSLSTLAIYRMFTFDYKGAEKAGAEAKKLANSKFERENVDNQLKATKKRAKSFQKQLVAYEKAISQTAKKGKPQAIENPFGGLGGTGGLGG
jgi:hypothetical protein